MQIFTVVIILFLIVEIGDFGSLVFLVYRWILLRKQYFLIYFPYPRGVLNLQVQTVKSGTV